MKKAVSLILTLILILAAFSATSAEETGKEDLFDLWDRNGDSPVRIASVVPLVKGVVVVPAALLPENREHLFVSDGMSSWEVKAAIPDDTGMIATVFYEAADTPARFDGWPLLPSGGSVPASSCVVRGTDGEGIRTETAVLSAEEFSREGRRCLLLSLAGPVSPGSAVLTANEQIAGIVLAEWAEGTNRFLAIAPEEIAKSIAGAGSLLSNLEGWGTAPEGLKVTLEKNQATIDWKEMALPEKAEGETLYLIVADMANNYLHFFPAETENRVITMLMTPGRFYIAGVKAFAEIPSEFPESFVSFYIPQAERLTEYSFCPVRTAVAEAPEAGLKEGEAPVPVTEVTEEMLRSGRAYFYSHSTYNIPGNTQSRTLLIALTDPKGVNYRYESGWVYDRQYMNEDIWYLSLKEIGLTGMLDRNGYPAGVYQLAFYIDGELADAVVFELK